MAEIKELLKGYKEFFSKYFESGDKLYKQLTEVGQFPKTLIISCSDSRVDPSILMNAKPGDIFTIRNVANLVPPYEAGDDGFHGVSAALEFAVKFLKVRNIVILGHSNCAGISALLNSDKMEQTDFIGKWMNIGTTAKERTIAKAESSDPNFLQHKCEKEGIIHSLENLNTFPWIKSAIQNKELNIHGWYFKLETGELFQYDESKEEFEAIT